MEDRILDIEEAAEYLRIAKGTLSNWVYKKKIPYRKHGGKPVFSLKELQDWSKRQSVPEHPIWSKA